MNLIEGYRMMTQQFYIGKIFKIDDELTAEISIFSDTQPFKNCKYFGVHSSEVKIGDQALVVQMSKELFLYTPLQIDRYLGLKNGISAIDLTTPGTIVNTADHIINDCADNKIGGPEANFTPLVLEDVLTFTGTIAGSPATGTVTLSGPPKCQTVKIK